MKKKWTKLKIPIIGTLLILLFLGACTSNSERILDGKVLNRHSGDGPDQLVFLDDELQVSTEGNIPPFLPSSENNEELEETNTYIYKGINLTDGQDDEIIVSYDDKELFKFQQDENNMLKDQSGTVYSIDD